MTYSTKDGQVKRFEPLEFLALLCAHLPRPYESLIRFYGAYSCRVRGQQRKKAAEQKKKAEQGSEVQLAELPTKASSTWAACIKRIYEINPLECPKCKATMRVIAFITDEKAIAGIMKSQGIPEQKPPKPLGRGPSVDVEYFDTGPEYW